MQSLKKNEKKKTLLARFENKISKEEIYKRKMCSVTLDAEVRNDIISPPHQHPDT